MRTNQVIDFITQWMKDYTLSARQKGLVIGISGGIDSAVTSTLAAKTGLPTLVIDMPIHQKKDQRSRGLEHITWLKSKFDNVESLSLDLTSTFDEFVKVVEPENQEQTLLSLANTRARLRMATLYYYAGIHHYLVTGTGNKIEDFGVGFFTKYGDGGVDISPIADLMKSEVYEIAKELNIISSIQQAKPTDGLWEDNRTDEDQIGASYDELEWAMNVLLGSQKKPTDLTERQKEVLAIFQRLNKAMQHKVNPIPVAKIPKELR